jgi:hypothetical protein
MLADDRHVAITLAWAIPSGSPAAHGQIFHPSCSTLPTELGTKCPTARDSNQRQAALNREREVHMTFLTSNLESRWLISIAHDFEKNSGDRPV